MAATSWDAFVDFLQESQGSALVTDPTKFINAASLRNYGNLNVFSRAKKELSAGSDIRFQIFFSDEGPADTIVPSQTRTIVNPQFLKNGRAPWRFHEGQMAYTKQELELNEQTRMSKQFVDLEDAKWAQSVTNILNDFERKLVATPNNANMESTDGKEFYSIRASITSDGLAPSGFTTVHQINPTTEENWQNQTSTYDKDALFDADAGLLHGFDQMWQLVRFEQPAINIEGGEWVDSKLEDCVVLTNREGERDYLKVVRALNDITRLGPQDPAVPGATYQGVRVKATEAYDDQSVFTSGSPDFLFANLNWFKLCHHPDHFFTRTKVFEAYDKHDTVVQYVELWGNLTNMNRRASGYLAGN